MAEFFQSFWQHLRPGGRAIGDDIRRAISLTPRTTLDIAGFKIPITDAMISLLITIVIVIIGGVWLGHGLKKRGISKRQALIEKIWLGLITLANQAGLNRNQAERLLPWAMSMGLYITVTNILAVIKIYPGPANPAVPFALAIYTLGFVILMGMRFVGVKGFFLSLADPMTMLIPFSILDYIVKPISLCFRLFGNIFGAYVLIAFFDAVMPLFVPAVLGLWFDFGDGIVQGLIFFYLTVVYTGEIVEKAEHARAVRTERQLSNRTARPTAAPVKKEC